MDVSSITALILAHKWIPLSAIVVGLVVRLLKDDTRLPTVPARARVWLVFALGIGSGVLEKISDGRTWNEALIDGLLAAVLALVGHEAIVKSARGGVEIPVPEVLRRHSVAAEPKPTIPASAAPKPDSASTFTGEGDGIAVNDEEKKTHP